MIEVFSAPSSWEKAPMWSLFTRVKRTGFPDAELLSVYRDYGVIPKSSRDDNHNVASEDLSAYQLVQPGDLVVNKMKAWQGSFAISNYEGIVSPAYFVFKPHHSASSKYLHYLLRSAPYMAHYNRISSGVRIGQWDLDPAQFRLTRVALPPLDEQKAIADFLDHELAQIDALIQKQDQLIYQLSYRKISVVDDSFANLDNFEMKKIKYVAGVEQRRITTNSMQEVPFFPMAAIGEWGGLSFGETKDLVSASSGYSLLAAGDVLIAKVTPCFENRKGTVVGDLGAEIALATTEVINVSPGKQVDSRFIWLAFLQTSFIESGTAAMTGAGGLKRVPTEFFKNFEIPVPDLTKQRNFADALYRKLQTSDELIEKAQRSNTKLKERRQSLISAAVTGKIDVRKVA